MHPETDILLSKYPEKIHALYRPAHDLLLEHFPGIMEIPDPAAGMIAFGFGYSYAETVCTLILSKKEIKLGFYKGADLPDPGHLLAGKGKIHKYVSLKTTGDCHNPMLWQLLKDAHKAYQHRQHHP